MRTSLDAGFVLTVLADYWHVNEPRVELVNPNPRLLWVNSSVMLNGTDLLANSAPAATWQGPQDKDLHGALHLSRYIGHENNLIFLNTLKHI